MADNKRLMIKPEGNTTAENEQKIYQDYLSTMAAKSAAIDNATTTPSIATTLYKAGDTFGATDNGTTVSAVAPNGETVTFAKNIGTTTVPETPATTTTDNGAAAYQSALNEVLASYQAAENERARALQKNYETALAQARDSYNAGKDSLQQSNDEALRQAYISYMLGQRGLNQQLSNGGINGGATESVLANLYNNYGNNRASINNEYQNALADLVNSYNSNVANLGMNYNTNYADALADYSKQVASVKQSYANNLASQLNKSNTSNTSTTSTETTSTTPTHRIDRATAVKVLSNYKNDLGYAIEYADRLGDYTYDEIIDMLDEAGIPPTRLAEYMANGNNTGNTANNGTANVGTNANANANATATDNTLGLTAEDEQDLYKMILGNMKVK